MAEPALRAYAVAGVLAAGVLLGGVTVAPAYADPTDTDGSSQDSGDSGDTSGAQSVAPEPDPDPGPDPDERTGDPSADPDPEPEPEPEDNTRTGDPEPDDDDEADTGAGPSSTSPSPPTPRQRESRRIEYSNSIGIPMFRLPAPGEIPTVQSFYTTVQIPVPTFQEFLATLRIVPPPAPPSPGPAFRTQDEAPIIDATTGTSGGGPLMAEQPPVFEAPLVTVPRVVTIGGASPRPVPTTPAGVAPRPGVTQPGVAGARTPVIRGSIPPTPGVSSPPPAAGMNSPVPRSTGYPRYLSNPTVAELAMVAVPGLAGLIALTFGGGVIGYRQANSVRYVRTAGAERFLP